VKPRLLNLAAGVSLLLAVAIVVLWVRSYWLVEGIHRIWHSSAEMRDWTVGSRYGRFHFINQRIPDKRPPIAPRYEYSDATQYNLPYPHASHWFPFPPVGFQYLPGPPSSNIRELTIAYWLLLLPTLPLPLIAIVLHRRRRHRETNNLCPTCGYDLRATPDRCPECGAVPAANASREPSA